MRAKSGAEKIRRFVCAAVVAVMLIAFYAPCAQAAAAYKATAAVKMYKSRNSTGSYLKIKKGAKLSVTAMKGKWAKVKYGGKTGYVLKSKLKKIETTSRAAGYRTLKRGARGAAVKKLQTRLCAKGYLKKKQINGYYGAATLRAVRQFQMFNNLGITGRASVATQKKLFSSRARKKPSVSITPWSKSDINSRFPRASKALIIDVATGTRIHIRRVYGSNHCDVEPWSKTDTRKLKKVYGGKWSWESRGVLLIAKGKCYAAAINSMPHGDQISHTNGYDGQFCLHLYKSTTHGSEEVNDNHQQMIKKVYEYFT